MRYEGYHDTNTLPIKKGQIITIKKGTKIRMPTAPPSIPEERVAKRDYQICVDHIVPGQSMLPYMMSERQRIRHGVDDWSQEEWDKKWVHLANPKIRWGGQSGYWCEVDINDVL